MFITIISLVKLFASVIDFMTDNSIGHAGNFHYEKHLKQIKFVFHAERI